MSRTYATEPEFKTYLDPDPVPEGAARLLRDASLEVDEMLITSVYRVDHDDMPVEPRVIEALRDATCAQAQHRDEYGDEVTIIENSEGVSLGPLSFGGKGGTQRGNSGATIPQHSPKSLRILRMAGLIPGTIQDG